MTTDAKTALFLMLGQSAERISRLHPSLAPPHTLLLSPSYDLSLMMPEAVREAVAASEGFKLFFVFEDYLRDLVLEVLSKDPNVNWWDKVPKDVQDEVTKLENTEEAKRWMALGSRDRSSLLTYPQFLKIIDDRWKDDFSDILRDKGLIHEARLIVHLRNTLCHMTNISEEEMERIRQVMRDWFRMVAP